MQSKAKVKTKTEGKNFGLKTKARPRLRPNITDWSDNL